MLPPELLQQIESTAFAAHLGVVSTPRHFERSLETLPVFSRLVAALRDPASAQELYEYAKGVASEPSVEPYCHRADLPLGVYLLALESAAPYFALALASRLLETPRLWWGRLIAASVQARSGSQNLTTGTDNFGGGFAASLFSSTGDLVFPGQAKAFKVDVVVSVGDIGRSLLDLSPGSFFVGRRTKAAA